MKRWVLLLMGIGLVFTAGAVAPPTSQSLLFDKTVFEGLGGSVGPDFFQNGAWGISTEGTTIVGSGYGDHAFIWNKENGMAPLPEVDRGPGGITGSTAFAVNMDGTVAAGCVEDIAGRPACRWTKVSGQWELEVVGDLAGGPFGSNFYAMNAGGNVLAGFVNFASNTEAARWIFADGEWTIEYLGDLPGGNYNSEAWGCSADGSVVVGWSEVGSKKTGYGPRAFRWEASAGMVDLGTIGTRKWSRASGCSGDGSVVIGDTYADFGRDRVAFRWTPATGMQSLGILSGGKMSEALAVSVDGLVVVGIASTRREGDKAIIWDAVNGMRRIDQVLAARDVSTSGWNLLRAEAVATPEPGVVVITGKGLNPQGYAEAWRAVIIGY